jgi:hypothetical protein
MNFFRHEDNIFNLTLITQLSKEVLYSDTIKMEKYFVIRLHYSDKLHKDLVFNKEIDRNRFFDSLSNNICLDLLSDNICLDHF